MMSSIQIQMISRMALCVPPSQIQHRRHVVGKTGTDNDKKQQRRIILCRF